MNRRNFLTKLGLTSLFAGIPAIALAKSRKHISEEPHIEGRGRITFKCGGDKGDILTLCPDGNIYVKDYLVETDKEAVEAFKEWLARMKHS